MSLTREDLQAISGLVSDLLEPMRQDMKEMKSDICEVKVHVIRLEERVTRLEERVTRLEERVTRLEEHVTHLEEHVTHLEERVTNLEECVTHLEERVTHLDERMTGVEMTLENKTNHNIQLLAENHLTLITKLNEAIEVQKKCYVHEVQVSGLRDRVEKVEREVAELREKIA